MYFSTRYLTARAGQVPSMLGTIGDRLPALNLQGKLVACLYSEVGLLNRILMIHAHETMAALAEDQLVVTAEADAFGVAATTEEATFDIFAGFPDTSLLAPGQHGPLYEVRTYAIKSNGIPPTHAAWAKVLARRTGISDLLAVMHSVTGPTRFMHVWPYKSFEARAALRAQAVAEGIWPPPGGILQIDTMQSELFLPAPFSPAR